MEFQKIKITDLEDVWALYCDSINSKEYSGSVWSREQFQQELNEAVCYGLLKDQKWVAVLMLRDLGDFEITWLGVLKCHRRQGLMKRLLGEFVACFVVGASKCVFLEVHEANKGAYNFYKCFGFKQVGQRLNYYSDGANALVMKWIESGE